MDQVRADIVAAPSPSLHRVEVDPVPMAHNSNSAIWRDRDVMRVAGDSARVSVAPGIV